jgi:hypothetical protein
MTGDLCRRFKVPGHLQQNDVLVSALFPWLLPASKRKEESRQPYFADEVPSSTLDSRPREVTLKRCPAYHRALYILRFPRWLYDHMSRRRYCLWWTPADGTKECGIETELLRSILTQCQASDVGHKAHVRIVFVHVGALKSLHKLPALAERRNKRPEIDFYTYGTHESVPSSRWGIRGIFRVGTFLGPYFFDDFR